MASPAPSPFRKPGHSSTTYTLAPPPPPPNWSQTPTPGGVMPYPYSYPQPPRHVPHHAVGASPGPPVHRTPQQAAHAAGNARRGSAGSAANMNMPPPRPLGLPETPDFFAPPVSSGKGVPTGRITPQNDPHRRALYLGGSVPGSPDAGAEEGESESGSGSGEEYGLEDQPWGDYPAQYQRAQQGKQARGGGIMGVVAGLVGGGGGGGGKARGLTDDEEALRAREESRREAERILAQERGRQASQSVSEIERLDMEEEVLRMLGTPSKSPRALPPTTGPGPGLSGPPTPNSAAPATPGTPGSGKGTPSWWTAAKARLTPSKEREANGREGKELTPAQLVIAESRGGKLRKQRSSSVGASEREREGNGRGRSSWFSPRTSVDLASGSPGGQGGKKDWPAKGEKKFDDPAFALLNGNGNGNGPPTTGPQDHTRTRTQSLPPRAQQAGAGHLSAPSTPMHGPPTTSHPHAHAQQVQAGSTLSHSPAPSFLSAPLPGRSPYLSHTPSGALNLPDSVLAMASRLEKLERWTVAHVRALEDRMKEVEEYVVGREPAWDAAELGVGELRKGLQELKGATIALREAKPPAPEDTELGRAINSAWRKEHGLPDGPGVGLGLGRGAGRGVPVPETRESSVQRVVSSVKSSEDDLRAMAQAQRAVLAAKPGSARTGTSTNTGYGNNGNGTSTDNGNGNGNNGREGTHLAPTTAGRLPAEEDRVSLSGLADTLTDYSRMFLADGEPDVSRNTSLARSAASDDTDEHASAGHARGRVVMQEDDDDGMDGADAGSIASDATEAAHSLHSGPGSLAETGPRTPPATTSLPLPSTGSPMSLVNNNSNSNSPGTTPLAVGRLPRPMGDYRGEEVSPGSAGLKLPAGDREREREVAPLAPSPVGRRRYTAALGGKGGKTEKTEKTESLKSAREREKEEGKALLPTPDTPGTEKFESSPEKVGRPKAQRAHTTSYSVSSAPAMPPPSSFNANAANAAGKQQGEFFTTTRPRPRPHSTYAPLSNQSPAPIKIPPTHTRPKQVGLGFVDPLVIRKEVKDAGREVKSLEGLKAVRAGKKTAKVGDMVKFFDKQ
ncbi:hypothetical protein CALCODRAFT_519040 [Calocera cornea HHB12733]|uniref:Uncharacterized protein n=1 Tax=Calocera cornea HHB12733 TaxID=1353952 RepID=A0A165EJK9_9BASI|nr:hypothetical protein CALCODRAFT_519040 [Calocera cornea HHB12733]